MWPLSKSNKMQTPDIPVGNDLASRVADTLDAGHCLAYAHRDYCGMGLCKDGATYIYDEVNDGNIVRKRASDFAPSPDERLEFKSRDAFIAWLQEQSDHSLSGQSLANTWLHNNQRITVGRLHEFAANNSFKPNLLRGSA